MFVERIQPPGVRSTEFRTSLGSVALEFALLLDRRGMARLVAEVPAGAEAEVKQRAAGRQVQEFSLPTPNSLPTLPSSVQVD